MARTNNLTNFLTDVANAIRSKTGKTGNIYCEDFDTEIESISGGGSPNLQSKSVTIQTNTTTNITADSGYDGLSDVEVITNVSGGGAPEVGTLFSNWDNSGYPHTAEYGGRDTVASQYFATMSDGTLGITSQLENITLKNDVKYINTSSFSNCKSLVNLTLSNNLITIGNSAFIGCTSLALTSLPNTVTLIDANAFNGCTSLALTSLPNTATSIGNYAFTGCTNLALTSLPSGLTSIGNNVFTNCSSILLTSLPSGLTTIGQYAFAGCTNLALTSLPSGLTTIGVNAFSGCSSLALTTLPDGIVRVNTSEFRNCINLKKMSMLNITLLTGSSISNGSFQGCSGLKRVWIGSAVTNSGMPRYAFYQCTALEKIYINLPRATVQAFTNYQYAFMNDTSKTGIIVCNDDSGFISKADFDALVIN